MCLCVCVCVCVFVCLCVCVVFSPLEAGCSSVSICSSALDPLSCFLFQPVLHNWCNKSWYGMVHIKDPLWLVRKSSPCSDGREFSVII